MKKNLLLAAILLCCQSIYAYEGEDDDYSHDFEKDGILYDITSEIELTVEVNRSFSDEHQYRGDIVIPKEVEHNTKIYTVTGIDDEAFYGCHELTSIKLPNTIKYIGGSAFLRCNKLSNIDIPHSVVEIGRAAFSRCDSLASVTLGGSIVDIEEDVFSFCKKLKYIKIPNSVKNIGTQAFYGCSNLKNIDFGENTNNIGSEAFGATEWYNVQPEGIVYAGKVVYDYKGTMPENTSINLIDGTLGIANGVFSYTKLSDIKIPNSVITIGENAFYGCSEITKIEIPNSVIKIGKSAFYDCDGLKDVSLGNSLVNIDNEAFYDCDRLDSIDIPHSVIRIGSEAFMSCDSLASVTIGKSVSEIEFCAFKGCKNLKFVINYSDLNLVGNSERHGYVAYYAKKIINADDRVDDFFFQITDSVVYLSDYIGNEKELSLPQHYNNGSYSIGTFAFSGDSLTSVFIPDKVKSIGKGAFSHCLSLTNVTIGDSVSKIGEDAFFRCISLPNIKIPNNVVEIGHGAFGRCTELKKVVIGESVRLIGSGAFNQCSNLTDISLGKDVVYIGYNAFADCRSLTNIYISDIRAWCNIDYYSQNEQPMRWANHLYLNGKEVKDLTLPNGIQDIKDYAFYGCDSLKSVNIPNTVTSIGNETFYGCTSLKSVNIPNTVTSIGNETFYNCVSLNSVSIPNSVTSIGNRAFSRCTSLSAIKIPNSVTSIGDEAFYYCRGLKRVTLGKSIMNIGKTAFEPYYLDSMVVRSEFPPRIIDGAFSKNSTVNGKNVYMATLLVPKGCEDMYRNADVWSEFEEILPYGMAIKVNITDYDSLLYGTRLELTDVDTKEKSIIYVTNQSAYTFEGIEEGKSYNLYLKNMKNDTLGLIENIKSENLETTVNLSISKRPQIVKVCVMLPHGLNVTDNISISWYDENNKYLSQGNSLSGVLKGNKVYYKIKLPNVLAEQYQTPSITSYEVKNSANNIVCTLEPYNKIKISGYVKEEGTNSPLSGISVNIEQLIGNGIKKTSTSVSDESGLFTAEIYNTEGKVSVSNPCYLSQSFNIKPEKETILDDIVMQPIDGSVIVLDYSFKESVDDEQESETVDWYYDEKNVVYTIFNKTKNAEVNNFFMQNSGIVLQEKVEENDVLLITAKSKTQKFKDITVECVMNALGQVKVTIPVVELGILKAYCQEMNASKAVGLLYNSEGNFVKKEQYSANTLTIKDIPDGEYTLISMEQSDFLNSLPNMSEFEKVGMDANTDFLTNKVNINSGELTSIQIGNIPDLEESRFYYTTAGCGIVANKPSVMAGEYIVLKANVHFKEENAADISNLRAIVNLPNGCELYPNTVVVNAQLANYTLEDNLVKIDLTEPTNDIRLCIIPNKPGVIEPCGSLQFDINGNNITQPIGAAHFVCKAFDLSVPGLTNDSIISVGGTANRKGADVYIYDNTKLVGQTISLADGNWQTDIKLYKPYTRTYHKIHAEIVDADGNKFPTETKTVEFDKNLQQVLEKIVMYYQGQEIIFNNSEGTNSKNSYTYAPYPDYCEFTFTAHFSKNDANTISNLEFKVLASDGSTRTIPGRYNESQDVWTGTSKYPNSNKIPVNVTVSYNSTEYVSPIFDDEMDADFKQMTQTIFNEIDSAYMNASIEVIEQRDSSLYFSVLTAYNTKEYFKFSILDYEKTINTYKDKEMTFVKNDTSDLCSVYELINGNTHFVMWDNIGKNAYLMIHSGQRPIANDDKKRILPFIIGAGASVASAAFEYNIFMQEINSWYNTVNDEKEERVKRYNKMRELLFATCEDGSLKIKDETKLAMCINMANQWNHSSKKFIEDFTTVIDEDKRNLQQRCSLKGIIGVGVGAAFSMVGALGTIAGTLFSKGASTFAQNIGSMAPTLLTESASQIVSNKLGNDIDNIDEELKKNGVKKVVSQWYVENSKINMDGYVKLIQTIKSSYSSCEKEEEKEEEGEKDNPKNNTDKESKNDRFDESVEYRNPNLQPAIDPSGYVYESVPSNRLRGVTATIFYQEKEEDIYGNITDKAVLWNAEEFSQKNPLVTDAEGKYQWDVPQGLWQVKFEKEGYETTYSEWLPVPPPQLEVNIAMTQNTHPIVNSAHAYADGIDLEFDKYMVPELLNIYTIKVAQNGEMVNGTIEYINEEITNSGKTYVSKVKFVPEKHFTADKVNITIKSVVQSYAGIAMAEDYMDTLDVEYRITSIEVDSLVNIYCDSTKMLVVSVMPAKAAYGKVLRVRSTSPKIANVPDMVYELDEDGKAYIKLNGVLPGSASLKYAIDDYDISAQTNIKVKMYTGIFCDTPFASIKSGSEVEKGCKVRLYCNTEGATIYYTLDGSCPCNDTPSRKVYDGIPIVINESVIIKAMAVSPYLPESEVVEFEYIVINSSSINLTDNSELYISPLPLKDKLNIRLDGKVIKTASLLTIKGETITRIHPQSEKASMNVGHLSSGVYILHIVTTDKIYSLKLVKSDK